MSEFKFACPHCSQTISATPEYSGMEIDCPGCHTKLVVPQDPAAPAATAPKLSMAASTAPHPEHANPAAPILPPVRRKKSHARLYINIAVTIAVVAAAILFGPKLWEKYHKRAENALTGNEPTNAPPPPPPELTADEVLNKLGAAYKEMSTYRVEAQSVLNLDISLLNPAVKGPQMSTAKVTLELGRPDLYRLEWERPAGAPTAVAAAAWSTGKGNFVRIAGAPSKAKSREAAFAVSGTLAPLVADLFYFDTNSLPMAFKDYAKTNDESINGQLCYVLAGQIDFQNILVWVKKSDFMIAQSEEVFGAKRDESSLIGLSNAEKTRALNMAKIKGSVIETYSNIQKNQPMDAKVFETASVPAAAAPAAPPARVPRRPRPAAQ